MSASRVIILTKNPYKAKEAADILLPMGLSVESVDRTIEEIQTDDVKKLVTDKALKAFSSLGRPLFVEHTGLYFPSLGGLPGGLTQVFWDSLEAENFSRLFGGVVGRDVIAQTDICYCDGRRFHHFSGSITGDIADSPRGPKGFQWDCVFVPKGHTMTFAEMGVLKNEISMRRIALNHFAQYIKGLHAGN